mmetsp:Transcript_19546/g.31281  ORF Transcript_19546/g.31281 Transcript_19546/m.31281 type:complete len:97 (-) Transcript_19546:313-603(-)
MPLPKDSYRCLFKIMGSLIFEPSSTGLPHHQRLPHNPQHDMRDDGTNKQKVQWLLDMVAGKKLGSYCGSEPSGLKKRTSAAESSLQPGGSTAWPSW